jgi:hypothetical protein
VEVEVAQQDHRDPKDHWVLRVLRVLLEQQVLKEQLTLLAHRAQQVLQAPLEQQGLLVLSVLLEQQVLQVLVDLQALQALLEQQDILVP